MKLFRFIVLTLCIVLSISAYAQAETAIPLYLKPFDTGKPATTISHTELQALKPQVLKVDGKVSDEWFWVEHVIEQKGYVRTSEVTKNLTVATGTLLYASKQTDSPILATVADPQALSILNLEGEWVSARYTANTTLYFQRPGLTSEQPAVLVQQPVPTQLVPAAKPVPASPVKATAAQDQVIAVPAAPIQTHTSIASVVQPDDEIPDAQYYTMDGKPIDPRTFYIPDTALSGSIVEGAETTRYFEGRLKRNKGLLVRNRQYEYILAGYDGKNLAYIDTTDLIQSTALEKYLQQDIVVHGIAEKNQASPPLTIFARYIQPK